MSRRRLLFAVVPLALLLGATELLLTLLDLGGRAHYLSRGFDPDAAYLVPDAEHPGGWRTAFRVGDELAIPAKGEALRIVLLGGSNVAWLPDWLLGPQLDRQHPGRRHEVLNLGREGYGSERVAILARQALLLEPDVLVVYSGHNEFIERGFALELDDEYGGPGMRRAAELLSHLRLFNLLAARPVSAEESLAIEPGARGMEGQPLVETLRYWEAYGENLGRLCDDAALAGVPVLLCTPVSNLLSPPFDFDESTLLPPAAAEAHRELRNRGVQKIPEPLRRGLLPTLRLRPGDWLLGELGEPYTAPQLRTLSGLLAEDGRTEGPNYASVAGAHWPDPAHWTADARTLVGTTARVLSRRLDKGQTTRLQGARAILEKALEELPDDPFARYALGLVEWLLGRDDAAAVQQFAVAASYDRAPRSAHATSNAIVRRVAATHPGATLLDTAQRFASRCPSGLTTFEIFMDHCHLQPGARGVLLADMAEALEQLLP